MTYWDTKTERCRLSNETGLQGCHQRVPKWKEISAMAMGGNTVTMCSYRQDQKVMPIRQCRKWGGWNHIEPCWRDGALWSVFWPAANEGSSSSRGWLQSTEKRLLGRKPRRGRPQADWQTGTSGQTLLHFFPKRSLPFLRCHGWNLPVVEQWEWTFDELFPHAGKMAMERKNEVYGGGETF